MRSRPPVSVTAYTAATALGQGKAAHQAAFQAHASGLTPFEWQDVGSAPPASPASAPLPTWVGRVAGLETPLPAAWAHWDCRNHRLAWKGLQADGFDQAVRDAVHRHGAGRVAVVLGTTTASIGATEGAYRQWVTNGVFPEQPDNPRLHTLHSLCAFVQDALGLEGPGLTISTACSSSAKAFATGERLLAMNLADAVLVGGVDSLCGSALFGFNALQLVSPDPCRPFDTHRHGINLGEAAAFALLERGDGALQLLGCGESSDAYHLSAPRPDGRGAAAAIDQALARADLVAARVDYLHAHGTGTLKNDAAEAMVIRERFQARTRISSTKGHTGHTLGTAGVLGAVFSLMALETGWLPGTVGCETPEADIAPFLLLKPAHQRIRTAMCLAFGFGGSNAALVFGAEGQTA